MSSPIPGGVDEGDVRWFRAGFGGPQSPTNIHTPRLKLCRIYSSHPSPEPIIPGPSNGCPMEIPRSCRVVMEGAFEPPGLEPLTWTHHRSRTINDSVDSPGTTAPHVLLPTPSGAADFDRSNVPVVRSTAVDNGRRGLGGIRAVDRARKGEGTVSGRVFQRGHSMLLHNHPKRPSVSDWQSGLAVRTGSPMIPMCLGMIEVEIFEKQKTPGVNGISSRRQIVFGM